MDNDNINDEGEDDVLLDLEQDFPREEEFVFEFEEAEDGFTFESDFEE